MNPLIKVGSYQLGYRPVDLFIDTSHSAGSGDFVPDKTGGVQALSRIIVGVKDIQLWSAWGTLTHEVMEMSLCDHQASYKKTGVFCASTEERMFVLCHRTFTRVCDEAGNFLHVCQADFNRAFHKARRKKSSKRKS